MLIRMQNVLCTTLAATGWLFLASACGSSSQHPAGSMVSSADDSSHYFKATLAPFAKISVDGGSSRQPDRFTAECSGESLVTDYITGYGSADERTSLNLTTGAITSFGKQLLPPDQGGDASSYLAALKKMQSVLEIIKADKAVDFIKAAIGEASAPSLETDSTSGKQITVQGDEAGAMIDALFQSGVRDPSGRLGALHLTLEGITCSAPTVPSPSANCTLSFDDKSQEVPKTAALAIFKILKAHGAIVPRDLLGIDIVGASQIDCQRVTVHNGVSSCTFNKP